MESAAYWVALLTVVLVPPFYLLWFIVHPFTRHWRKVGAVKTYLALSVLLAPVAVALYLVREPVLAIRFGVRGSLVGAAIALALVSFGIGGWRMRHLTPGVLLGLPQLSPRRYPGKLLAEGPYAHIRHPRYVEAGLGLLATALFCNYLAVYLVAAAYVPIIYVVVLLEERELRDRFGEAYDDYCRRVPRFIPRLFGRPQDGA